MGKTEVILEKLKTNIHTYTYKYGTVYIYTVIFINWYVFRAIKGE